MRRAGVRGVTGRGRISLMALLLAVFPDVNGMPEGAEAVRNFSLERYLGTWYEIARLDHRFERNLSRVTATYSMNEDGTVKVINRGYNTKKARWSEAEGKARFVDSADVGRLKVTFFWPFYGAYNVIALEAESYGYAMVIGNNTKYLWILAREPELEPAVLKGLLDQARSLGFATDELIYPQREGGTGPAVP